jgi:hypothetical protein
MLTVLCIDVLLCTFLLGYIAIELSLLRRLISSIDKEATKRRDNVAGGLEKRLLEVVNTREFRKKRMDF